MTFVSIGVRCFPLASRGFPAGPRGVFGERVHNIRSCNVTLLGFRRCGSLGSFLILLSLIHQLFDAPITQHHLHQRGLRLPFLDISKGKFDSVEVKTIVVGFGRIVIAPGIATRRLARA